ncbi:hypothetical protein KF840_19290 [bacterium]|nr:hypothetical protein [bacterium]
MFRSGNAPLVEGHRSKQPDVEAVAAWFMERQRLLFEVIEVTRYDLGEHVEALATVVQFIRAGERALALELLEREVASVNALIMALSTTDGEG